MFFKFFWNFPPWRVQKVCLLFWKKNLCFSKNHAKWLEKTDVWFKKIIFCVKYIFLKKKFPRAREIFLQNFFKIFFPLAKTFSNFLNFLKLSQILNLNNLPNFDRNLMCCTVLEMAHYADWNYNIIFYFLKLSQLSQNETFSNFLKFKTWITCPILIGI